MPAVRPRKAVCARSDFQGDAWKALNIAGKAFRVRVNTKVYKTGSHSGKVLGKLKKGLSVVATGKLAVDSTGVFYVQIAYNSRIGWVPETALRGASDMINKKVLK